MPAIDVEGVSKVFGSSGAEQVEALHDVSLSVEQGEFVVLLGPSGCGKTTLLRILGQLEQPTVGTVRMAPSTDGDSGRGRSSIGFVFQDATLLPWRSALRNVELPMELYGASASQRNQRASQLLRLVGLEGFERKLPHQLSGGMRQRVSIARALSHDPSVLLMDEPFGALDAQTRDSMNLELQRIWLESGKTVVFVTHSVQEAIFLADRIVLLATRPGRVHSITDVRFARPRSMDLIEQPEFRAMAQALRSEIGQVRGGGHDLDRDADERS